MPDLWLKGVPIGKVEAILFDKDGTLSNSEDYLLNIGLLRIKEAKKLLSSKDFKYNSQQILDLEDLLYKTYGISNLEINPHGTMAIGTREQNLFSTATIFCVLGESWPKACELAKEIFKNVDSLERNIQSTSNGRHLMLGLPRLLKDLYNADVMCAVISNDSKSGIQQFLRLNNLEKHFQCFWSADNHPSKPDPDAVIGLCNLLGVSPEQCALIGDSDSDLKMAKQAGINLILGYVSGWKKPLELKAQHKAIKSWDELVVK